MAFCLSCCFCLLELFEIVVLPLLSLLQVVLLSLEPDNGLPQLGGLALELIVVHGVEVEGLDADGQGDLLFLLQLLLGLGHLTASVLDIAHSAVSLLDGALGALSGGLLLLLLSLHHGLPLLLSFLQTLPLLLGLLGSLFPPFVDVLLELLVQLALLGFLAGLEEVSISLLRGVGSNFLLLIVFLVRHGDCLCAYSIRVI